MVYFTAIVQRHVRQSINCINWYQFHYFQVKYFNVKRSQQSYDFKFYKTIGTFLVNSNSHLFHESDFQLKEGDSANAFPQVINYTTELFTFRTDWFTRAALPLPSHYPVAALAEL